MGNSIANLAVKLSLDGAGFENGIKLSETSTRRWGGTLDGIIQKMEMQSQGLEQGSRRAAIFAAAQKGANTATVEYALSLDRQLESTERLAAAEAAAIQAEKMRRSSVTQIIQSLREEYATYGLTNGEIQVYKLQQLGADEATLKHARSLANKIELLKQEAMASKSVAGSSRMAMGADADGMAATLAASAAMSKKLMVVQALAFGVEDAATVYGTSGFSGAVRASANNVVMASMLINPKIGIYVALGSAVLQLGMAFMKSSQNVKTSADMLEEYHERVQRITKLQETAVSRQNQVDALGSPDDAAKSLSTLEEQIESKKNALKTAVAEMQPLIDGLTQEKTWDDFWAWEGNFSKGDQKIVSGENKKIEAMRSELEEMMKFRERLKAEEDRLKDDRALNQQMEAEAQQAQEERRLHDERIERLDELARRYVDLSKGPMTQYNEKLMELTEVYDAGRISESQFRVNMSKLDQQFLNPSADAQRYIDNTMTPMEKYEKELNKLQKELARGDISESIYDQNAKLLQDQFFRPGDLITNATGGAAAEGSADAFKSIASVITADQSKDGVANLNKTAAEHLAESKKQTKELEKVREKLEIEEASL